MIIAFTGTRQLHKVSKNRLGKLNALLFIDQYNNPDIKLVHGCAKGADTYIHEICLELKIPIIGRPTYNMNDDLIKNDFYDLYSPLPPLTRNKRIVEDCDILIALPIDKDVEELRSGTWATIRHARKLNKKIIII